MEIVQTGTSTWLWCISMFGARFAVFVRRARVLPSPCPATRNLCVLEVSPAPSPCCFKSLFTGMVRVGAKIPQDGNRANRYRHVAMVPGHVWRTLCSVCATGARVARPVPCNLSFLRFHRHHWTGTGWYENSTRWKSHKHVRARGGGA